MKLAEATEQTEMRSMTDEKYEKGERNEKMSHNDYRKKLNVVEPGGVQVLMIKIGNLIIAKRVNHINLKGF